MFKEGESSECMGARFGQGNARPHRWGILVVLRGRVIWIARRRLGKTRVLSWIVIVVVQKAGADMPCLGT